MTVENISWSNLHKRIFNPVGVDLATSWLSAGRAYNWATKARILERGIHLKQERNQINKTICSVQELNSNVIGNTGHASFN